MTATPDEPQAWLWDQYKVAIDEYRFQVDLNWRRTQYFFALNAAVLVAAIGLLRTGADLPAVVEVAPFFVGVATSLLALAANSTQKEYYRATQDTKRALEQRLGLGELATRTTPGMGSKRKRKLGKVTTLQNVVLWVFVLANVAGMASVAFRPQTEPSSDNVKCRIDNRQPASTVSCTISRGS